MASNPKVHLGNHVIEFEGQELELFVFRSYYLFSPERFRIDLEDADGQPFFTLSLNNPQEELNSDEFIVKNYGENEGLWAQMEDFWLFQDTGKTDRYGRPIWRVFDDGKEVDEVYEAERKDHEEKSDSEPEV